MEKLCDECNEKYRRFKLSLFMGNPAYRPIFCKSCEEYYWMDKIKRYCEKEDK